MHHFALDRLVKGLEVWNLQGADGFDGQRQRLVGTAVAARIAQPLASRSQGTQHLSAVEPLTLTVITETHDGRRLPDPHFYQIVNRILNQYGGR